MKDKIKNQIPCPECKKQGKESFLSAKFFMDKGTLALVCYTCKFKKEFGN